MSLILRDDVKSLRKELSLKGYTVRTTYFSTDKVRVIVSKDDKYVLGHSNVFSKEHIQKYRDAFDIVNKYKR